MKNDIFKEQKVDQYDSKKGRMEWDGSKKKGADFAEPGRQPNVRSRVRSNRAMDHGDHRKWGPNGIRAMVMIGS